MSEPTVTEKIGTAISDATQKVTDEAAALFGGSGEVKSIAETAPV